MIKTALLCGAFGYGNLGDDLLRDVAVQLLNATFPDLQVFVDRPYPNQDLIDAVDLRIVGPGGLLYDSDDAHEQYFRAYLKKPFILMGVGLQDIPDLKLNGLTAQACREAEIIICRHLDDLPYIEKFRGNLDKVFPMPDFGYFFKPRCRFGVHRGEKPIITLIANNGTEIPAEVLPHINQILSFSVLNEDRVNSLARKITPHRTTIDFYHDTPDHHFNLIAGSDLVITGRYHGAVLANLAGVPVVSFNDNRKILMETGGQLVDWERVFDFAHGAERIPFSPIKFASSGHRIAEIREGNINPLAPLMPVHSDGRAQIEI